MTARINAFSMRKAPVPELRMFITPCIAFVFISGVMIALSHIPYSWDGWQPAACVPDACFGEAIRSGTVKQPANTWSCLGFVLVGLLIITTARHDASSPPGVQLNPMRARAAYGSVYGSALIAVGLGSALFHASLTRMGGFLDVTGMYLLASFILVYNFYRLYAIKERTFVLSYIVLNAVLIGALAQFPGVRRYIFAALILAALVVERQVRVEKKPLIETYWIKMALLFMGVAFIIWSLDITRTLSAPYSWLQGHAIWHILGAMAAGCLYLYYRSERSAQPHSSCHNEEYTTP